MLMHATVYSTLLLFMQDMLPVWKFPWEILQIQSFLSRLRNTFSTTKICQLISPLPHTVNSCIESLLQNTRWAEEVFTPLNHCVNKASDVVTEFQQGTSYFRYRSRTQWSSERMESESENQSYTEEFVCVVCYSREDKHCDFEKRTRK